MQRALSHAQPDCYIIPPNTPQAYMHPACPVTTHSSLLAPQQNVHSSPLHHTNIIKLIRSPHKAKPTHGGGSRSGQLNHRTAGDSDNEITLLDEKKRTTAELKAIEDLKGRRGLNDRDKELAVEYVTEPGWWKSFKFKQLVYWTDVCAKSLSHCGKLN